MFVFICVSVCVFVLLCLCSCLCLGLCLGVCLFVFAFAFLFFCVRVGLCLCLCVGLCLGLCLRLCLFVFVLVFWYIYVQLHLFLQDHDIFFSYGVATISRLLKIAGLFCKRALSKRRHSAKETYNFIDPTDRSHPITCYKKQYIML